MEKKTKEQIERDEHIYQITTLVAGGFKLDEVLDELARAAVKITKTKACSIRLLDEASSELKMSSSYGLSEDYCNRGQISVKDGVIKAAFNGEPVVLDDMRIDSRVKHKEAAIKEGLVSQLTVGMAFKNKPIGVLRLYSPKLKRFNEDDIALTRLVASQCAVAITNAKLYNRAIEGAKMAEQLRLASHIQRRMIPDKMPEIPCLDIAAIYRPCFQIGGDLYDFAQIDDHTITVGIADVIGKGVPAAIMMSMFRGAMRAYTDGGYQRHSMAEVVDRLNKIACKECRDGEFITLFTTNIDVKAMTITYCSCGHEPGLLIRENKIIELEKGGLVLGVIEDTKYDIGTMELKDKDTLLLYTDGVIDAVNFDGDFWGKENLIAAAKKHVNGSADQLVKNILAYQRRFVGLTSQLDDTSIVAIKINKAKEYE